jgi:hypothetical protein
VLYAHSLLPFSVEQQRKNRIDEYVLDTNQQDVLILQ